ncbi:amidohydrolase family protein [Streptomyces tricolor]|nr:amidohydrolase family protein [Streptomyces tricolor]
MAAFGPGRPMSGSDWPVCLPSAGHAHVRRTAREGPLGPAERTALFASTAVRAYDL